MIDQPMQPPRIPEDRATEYDLVVEVSIRPKTSYEGRERAYTRLRTPLERLLEPGNDDEIEAIKSRYADGFGDIDQAAEDVAYLLDQLGSRRMAPGRNELESAIERTIDALIDVNTVVIPEASDA